MNKTKEEIIEEINDLKEEKYHLEKVLEEDKEKEEEIIKEIHDLKEEIYHIEKVLESMGEETD